MTPNTDPQFQVISPRFYGEGKKYFAIIIVNWLLTIVTLGLYYPWARASNLQYNFSQTELLNSRFTFLGTGLEMFKGFIKLVLVYIGITSVYAIGAFTENIALIIIGMLLIFICAFLFVPLAIHGSMRYRMSKTSWKGLQFHYSGKLGELYTVYFKYLLITIFTFGIVSSWLLANIKKYVTEHIHYGNVTFEFRGTGGDYFVMLIKGYFLTIITLGVYIFWWQAAMIRFNFDNTFLKKDNQHIAYLKNSFTAGDSFTMFLYGLGCIFTLGLLYPWFIMEYTRIIIEKTSIIGYVDLDNVMQNITNQTNNATGEDMMDALDIDFAL